MQYHEIGKTGWKYHLLVLELLLLGGVFHDLKEKEGIEAVFTAVEAGMNFIDVSPYYGHYKAETVLRKSTVKILSSQPLLPFYQSGTLWKRWDESMLGLLWQSVLQKSVYESMERLNIRSSSIWSMCTMYEFADLNQVVNETSACFGWAAWKRSGKTRWNYWLAARKPEMGNWPCCQAVHWMCT